MLKSYGGDSAGGAKTLIGIIRELGLTTSLDLCFDAGDSDSYSGSGQNWLDLSGNGIDYERGLTSSATTDDPTFNGSAGALDETTYWSFDGGDRFGTVAANSVADAWAHNNAAFTIVSVVQAAGTTGTKPIAGNGTSGIALAAAFAVYMTGSPGVLNFQIDNGTVTATTKSTSANYPSAAPFFAGFAYDEASTALTMQINSTQEAFTTTASSVSATPTKDLRIGDDGLGAQLANGDRMWLFAAWDRKLSDAELTSLYQALKSRRFPSMA
jgi:hypothetical protein